MKAMYCTKPFSLELREEDLHIEGEDEVLVKVAYCGICPWDVRVFAGKKQVPLPRILGHEATGTVVDTGSGVSDLPAGKRVVADFIEKCGVCLMCRRGRSNKCTQPVYHKGGFAEYIRIPRKNVYPLKETTSMKAAALTEPLACVVRGQKMLELKPDSFEVIVGAGPIGLLHMQTAAAYGATTVVIDILPERLTKAKSLGADFTIDGSKTDQKQELEIITGGRKADGVVVTVPSTPIVEKAVELLAVGGRLNIFAGIYPQDDLIIDPNIIHYNEIKLLGSADSTPEDFFDALTLIESSKVETESLISHLYPLEKLQDGFQTVIDRTGMKVVAEIAGDN